MNENPAGGSIQRIGTIIDDLESSITDLEKIIGQTPYKQANGETRRIRGNCLSILNEIKGGIPVLQKKSFLFYIFINILSGRS